MLGRIVVALAVIASMSRDARAQGGYVEPPPSPPRDAAPPIAAPVEPPSRAEEPAAPPVEKPSTTTTTTTSTSTSTSPPTTTSASATAPLPPPATPPAHEPYSPPGMTWAGTPAGPHDPTPASTTHAILGGELGFGALASVGGGAAEVSLLADLGGWALGGVLTLGGLNEHLGVGLHLAGGPRFALGSARLDLQVDAGVVLFGDDGEESGLTSHSETSGSEEVLPAIGARLGVTFQSAASGWFLSLGAGIRHVQRKTVGYTVTDCKLLSPCVTTPATAEYGGTVAGGYLTIGRSYPRGR